MDREYVWMLVDLENKELPLVVADSCRELADKLGVSINSINSLISKTKKKGKKCKYVRVEVEEGD